jgi:hypothetical protein
MNFGKSAPAAGSGFGFAKAAPPPPAPDAAANAPADQAVAAEQPVVDAPNVAAPPAGDAAPAADAAAAPAPAAPKLGGFGTGAATSFGAGATSFGTAAPTVAIGSKTVAAAAPAAVVAVQYPVTSATVGMAVREGQIDDGLAGLVKTHLAAPLKKRVVSTAAAGAASAQPAFDAAQHARAVNDLNCLFMLATASRDTEGLLPLMTSLVAPLVTNLAQYLAAAPARPSNAGRFSTVGNTANQDAQREAELAIAAAELLLIVLSEWQCPEAPLKELLAAITVRVGDLAANGFTASASALATASSHAVQSVAVAQQHAVYLLCLCLVAALNVWSPVRLPTPVSGDRWGKNDLCRTRAPIAKHLAEWLDRTKKSLMPTAPAAAASTAAPAISGGFGIAAPPPVPTTAASSAAAAAKAPVAGRMLSICALAVGAFAHACEDDSGLDICLDATQSHTLPLRVGGLNRQRRVGAGRDSAAAVAASTADAKAAENAIAGYGKAFANIAALLPPPEAVSVPLRIPAGVAFGLVRHSVSTLAPLIHHLAELDVRSYQDLATYAETLTRRHKNAGQVHYDMLRTDGFGAGSGAPWEAAARRPVEAEPLPPLRVPTFHVPQLLDCIRVFMTVLPVTHLFDDDDVNDLRMETFDDVAPAAPMSSILHLLINNLPLHLRKVLDTRRQPDTYPQQQRSAIGVAVVTSDVLDPSANKTLASYLECLAQVARSSPSYADRVVKAMDTQVDCTELHLPALLAQLRSALGIETRSNAGVSAAAQANAVREAAIIASQAGANIRQLGIPYAEKQQARLATSIVRLLTSIAVRLGPQVIERQMPIDAVFAAMTAPNVRHVTAGELFALAASMIRSPASALAALNGLEAAGLIKLNRVVTTDPKRNANTTAANYIRVPVVDPTAAPAADLAAALEQESRIGTYHVTLGFLRLANAIAEYPLPNEAVSVIEFASHEIMCGLTRRSYVLQEEKHLIAALACSLLYRCLAPSAWISNNVPFAAVMAPTRAPSDVLGDCLALVSSAAHDAYAKRQALTPTRLVALREALRLISAAVAPPPPNTGIDNAATSSTMRSSDATASILLPNGTGSINSQYQRTTFAARARTYESPAFISNLIRLGLIEDCTCAASALELAAVLMPPSSSAILREVHAAPEVAAELIARFVHVTLPAVHCDFEPIVIPDSLIGTVGLIGHIAATSSQRLEPAEDEATARAWAAFVEREQDRLRNAVIDLALRGSLAHNPLLTMWLCGYPSTSPSNLPRGLPAWLSRGLASQSNQPQPIQPNHLLESVLIALNDADFGTEKPLLAAKYTKLVTMLLTNPSTNTRALEMFLESRDGLEFIDGIYSALGTVPPPDSDDTQAYQQQYPQQHQSSFLNESRNLQQVVADPAVVYRAAFTAKLLVLEFYNTATGRTSTVAAASRPAGNSFIGGAGQAQGGAAGENGFVQHHLYAMLAPSVAPEAVVLAPELGCETLPTIASWLITALEAAPAFPDIPNFALGQSAALVLPVATLAQQQAQATAAANGSQGSALSAGAGVISPFLDPFGVMPAESCVPYYDIGKLYYATREQELRLPEPQRRTTAQWRDLLSRYVEANHTYRAHMMVSAFVDVWAELVELMCTCFWSQLLVCQQLALVKTTLHAMQRLSESGVFAVPVRDSLCQTLSRVLAALVGSVQARLKANAADAAAASTPPGKNRRTSRAKSPSTC